jgi:EmrB/QacA subfamily drug resistance transporter
MTLWFSLMNQRVDPALLKLIGVLALGALMGTLDATVVNTGIPTLATRFDARLGTLEWVATGYLLAVSVATPLSGWAVDRYGGRRVWFAGLALFVAGSAACSLAWSTASLIAFRVVQGLGGGMLEPTMLTVLFRAAGPQRAGRAMGLVAVPITLGPAIGPVLGGLLVTHLDWRWMFLINLPLGALTILLSLRAVPADRPEHARRLDVLGLCLLSPGFATIVYALSVASHAGFAAAPVLVALAAGAALLAAYVVHALRRRAPVLDLRLFRYGRYTAGVVVMSLVGAVLFSSVFLMPEYYQHARGHDALTAGLLAAPFGLGSLVAMPLAGRLPDRIGSRVLAPVGALLAAASIGAFAIARNQALLVVCAALLGGGIGTAAASTMGAVFRVVPPADTAGASTALYVLNQIGGSLGIAVVTLTVTTGYAPGFALLAAVAIGIAALALALPGRPAPVPAEPALAT